MIKGRNLVRLLGWGGAPLLAGWLAGANLAQTALSQTALAQTVLAQTAPTATLTLRNDAASAIAEVHTRQRDRTEWQRLPLAAPLPPGARFAHRLEAGEGCVLGVRVVFAGGSTRDYAIVDLCRTLELAVKPPPAPGAAGARPLGVHNQARTSVHRLWIWPAGSPERGADRLGANTLPSGERAAVVLAPGAPCLNHVRVEYGDRRIETLAAVDLCAVTELTLNAGQAARPGRPGSIQVRNRSSADLLRVYASAGAGRGSNRLPAPLRPGENATIEMSEDNDRCLMRLEAVYAERFETRPDIDACSTRQVDFDGRAALPLPPLAASVVNAGSATVRGFELRAAGGGAWGSNRLPGGAPLRPGLVAPLDLGLRIDCLFDVRIVFSEGPPEERARQDLCADPIISAVRRLSRPDQVEVLNRSRETMVELYVSPSGAGRRGEDRLGAATLGAGQSFIVEFGGGDNSCQARVEALFRDAHRSLLDPVDLCEGRRLQIGERREALPRPTLDIANSGDVAIAQVYAYPPGASSLGSNRLRQSALRRGERVAIELEPLRGCAWTIRVVYANDMFEERSLGDLCRATALTFPR